MKKSILMGVALVGLTLAAPVHARSNVGFSIYITNAPPPPPVFRHPPRFVYDPEPRVYVVDEDDCNYDLFRYGSFFYAYNDGYWYRSRSYRGPFVAIHAEYVPQPIFHVSSNSYRWRERPHYGPPGWDKMQWRASKVSEKHGRHGHGHGHGHGHDRDDDRD